MPLNAAETMRLSWSTQDLIARNSFRAVAFSVLPDVTRLRSDASWARRHFCSGDGGASGLRHQRAFLAGVAVDVAQQAVGILGACLNLL